MDIISFLTAQAAFGLRSLLPAACPLLLDGFWIAAIELTNFCIGSDLRFYSLGGLTCYSVVGCTLGMLRRMLLGAVCWIFRGFFCALSCWTEAITVCVPLTTWLLRLSPRTIEIVCSFSPVPRRILLELSNSNGLFKSWSFTPIDFLGCFSRPELLISPLPISFDKSR